MPGIAIMEPSEPHDLVKEEDAEHDSFRNDESDSDQEDEESYKPRTALPEPYVGRRTLRWLIDSLDKGIIDVEPDYQRDVVWTAERMTGLVNSLMENFYVPPIILNKKKHVAEDGSPPTYTLATVDGKQRLSSVRAFVKGLIPCHDHRQSKWYFSKGGSTANRKLLSDAVREDFLDKEFISFEFNDLSQVQEEDLFARVQMGMPLSAAEKMRASTGPWQDLAQQFVKDFAVVFGLLKEQTRTRAKDFQFCLSCFSQIVEVEHPSGENGKPGLKTNASGLPRFLKNKAAIDDDLKSHLASVFTTFQCLVEEEPEIFTKKLQGVQTFAPLELIAIAVLISMYSSTRNNKLLLGDIQALRNRLRESFRDLRLNSNTWTWVWTWLDDLEGHRGAIDGSTIDRSVGAQLAQPAAVPTPQPVRQTPVPLPQPVVKRGRPSMRTKPTTNAPKKTVPTTEPSSNTRQRKRQRTDDDVKQEHIEPLMPAHWTASVPRQFGNSSIPSGNPMVAEGSPALSDPSSDSNPGRQSTHQSPVVIPLNDQLNDLQDIFRRSNPPARTSASQFTMPAETREQHIARLNGYRAPTAPMETVNTPSTQPSTIDLMTYPLPETHFPIFNPQAVALRPTKSGASKNFPISINDELEQFVHAAPSSSSTSTTNRFQSTPTANLHNQPQPPQNQTQSSTPRPRSGHQLRSQRPGPSSSQRTSPSSQSSSPTPMIGFGSAGDTIDLTSDTEQERQDLLSSFRKTAAPAKES
ncbi:hypothetical protein EJ04DRAFT_461026 [Polyplosphaeria fusca]|uniref:GmrSD restriction endonucleases N-terminal domain-containing protein n=1 Tax=Polyplosphaeria fusca TaxID=682080 RepID=A0A9P4V6N5_9PLEO|nr:hypothetical protein EJ04DRAFT_461026 [Polyplosphaeria fusca]